MYDIEEEKSDLIERMSWGALCVFLVEYDVERSVSLSTEDGTFSLICNELFNSEKVIPCKGR